MHSQLAVAGVVMGIGLGGFIDGILFHQLLQVHSMLSARLPPTALANMEVNMFWDGIFHAGTWFMTVWGLALLWRAASQGDVRGTGLTFIGGLLAGWGVFNLVEGLINHYILGIHHVVERLGLSVYDHAFLISGFLLCGVGLWLIRSRGSG